MLARLTDRLDWLYREREERYRAGVLLMALGISFAGNLLFPLSLVLAFGGMSPQQRIAVLASTVGALLNVAGGFVLLYMGRRRLATWAFLIVQWVIITLSTIPFGVGGGWAAAVPMMIVLAGFLLPWQGTLVLAALFVASMTAVGLLQVYSIPPTPPATGDDIILHLGLVIGATLVTGSVVSVLSGQISGLVAESLRWIRRMHAVFAVGKAMSTLTDFREMLLAVVEKIQEGFDFYHVQIFLVEQNGHTLALRASTVPEIEKILRVFDQPTVGEETIIGRAALGRAVIINDVTGNALFRAEKHLPYTQSEAALPMMTGGRVLGVLDVMSQSPSAFSGESIRALQALANQIAVAIQTTGEAAPEAAILEALTPVFCASREVMAAPDAKTIVTALHKSVLAGFDHISLVRFRDGSDGAALEELAVWDRDGAAPGAETPVALCQAADDEALLIANVFDLPEVWTAYQPFLRDRLALGSVGIFPLCGQVRPMGYMLAGKRQPYVFSEREHRTLMALSGQIALLLENKLLQREFELRSARLHRLGEFIEAVAAVSSMEGLYEALRDHLAGMVAYRYLSLTLWEPEQGVFRTVNLRSPDGRPGITETISSPGITVERAVEEKQTVITGDVIDLPDGDVWLRAGVRALTIAPLTLGDTPLGALNLGREEANSFAPEEIPLLERAAGQVAIAIQNIRLLEQTRTSLEDVSALLFAVRYLLAAGKASDILHALVEILSTRAAADRVIILQGESEGTYPPAFFEVAAAWNRVEDYSKFGGRIGERYLREDFPLLVREGDPNRTMVFEHVDSDPRLDESARASLREMGARAVMRLPMTRDQHWFGEVLLISCGGAPLTRADPQFYRAIVDQAAFALENTGMVERLSASVMEATTLYSTSLSMSVAQSMEEIVEVALSQLVTLNDAMQGYLYLAYPDPALRVEQVQLAAWWEETQVHWPEVESYVSTSSVPVLGQAPLAEEYVIFNDADGDDRLPEAVRDAFRARGVGSVALLSLRAGADWMGAVMLEGGGGHEFSEDTIKLCQGIADLCGLALNLQMALRRSRSMATQEQVLRVISDRIRSAPDVEAVLQIAVEELGQALSLKEGAALLKASPKEADAGE